MAQTILSPPQVASDDANVPKVVTFSHTAGAHSVTEIVTIKKLTSGGATGSITIKDGKVTSYVAPT